MTLVHYPWIKTTTKPHTSINQSYYSKINLQLTKKNIIFFCILKLTDDIDKKNPHNVPEYRQKPDTKS